jgi:hypothetical protein
MKTLMKARPAQGKGRKPSSSRKPSHEKSSVQQFDAVVKVGTAITFAPTGERLRITKIEGGEITFEKMP